MVTPLENIDSDRIVGIRCDFNDNSPLFILSVHLPAASHPIEEFNEYLDYPWALYDSLSKTGFVIVIVDFGSRTITPRTITPRTITPGQLPPRQLPP